MTPSTRNVAFGLLTIFGLSACQVTPENFDPNAGPNDNRNQGAVIGGLVGAVTGAIASDDDEFKGALIGGLVGAGAGAAIGANLDQQAADLRAQLDSRVQIVNTGDSLIVTMPQDILFAVNSATVRPDLQNDLLALANNLQVYASTTVDVIGHTDSDGDTGFNQDLSQRRANSVATVILSGGVAPSRVRAFGRGETEPVATNLTPEGKQQNRRVEIIIRPINA